MLVKGSISLAYQVARTVTRVNKTLQGRAASQHVLAYFTKRQTNKNAFVWCNKGRKLRLRSFQVASFPQTLATKHANATLALGNTSFPLSAEESETQTRLDLTWCRLSEDVEYANVKLHVFGIWSFTPEEFRDTAYLCEHTWTS